MTLIRHKNVRRLDVAVKNPRGVESRYALRYLTCNCPEFVGVEKAIDMCVTGKLITTPEALAAGLIDRIVDGELREGAAAFAREVSARGGSHPRTRDRSDRLGTPAANAPLFAAGRVLAAKIRPHQPASGSISRFTPCRKSVKPTGNFIAA